MPAANRPDSCSTKFRKSCLDFSIGRNFASVNRGHCGIDNPQFLLTGEIAPTLQFVFDLICNGDKFILRLFGPGLNTFKQSF